MNKLVYLTVFLSLVGCSKHPKYTVGDCYHVGLGQYKVIEVGGYGYVAIDRTGKKYHHPFYSFDDNSEKLDCDGGLK